ncbi:MAG: biotin/lipoyl-containing protein [Arcanobacterium sp.]|nr:biotin/lipoyl-containing protein [Arcanobacterium sp.]
MSEAIKMPALGESVTEGTITTWLKAVGDTVEVDEPIVEVSTDKVDTEVPSPVAGTLLSLEVAEDETVDVGTVLAYVGDASELAADGGSTSAAAPAADAANTAPANTPDTESAPVSPAAPAAPATPAPLSESAHATGRADAEMAREASTASSFRDEKAFAQPAQVQLPHEHPDQEQPDQAQPTPQGQSAPASSIADASEYVTPIVRKLAKDLGVSLSDVTGTGVGGRIRRQDVEAAAQALQEAQAAATSVTTSTSSTSRTPKDASSEASVVGAQYPALVIEIDADHLPDDYLPYVLKAAAEELERHSALNAGQAPAFGITLAATRGAFMPVLRGLAGKTPEEIRADLTDVTARAVRADIGPEDLFGSTISVVDNTEQGILLEVPRIQHTHVAALSIGPAQLRPAVIDEQGTLGARRQFFLSLSYDPNAADANIATTFLKAVQSKLEKY